MISFDKARVMLKRGRHQRVFRRRIVSKEVIRRRLRMPVFIFCLSIGLFQPTAVVWGDYLLTLKSGLQIRARNFQEDGTTIRVWTESGSMTLPRNIVNQITEIASPAHALPQTSSEKTPDSLSEEQARETPPVQKPVSPLYIPDERKSP
jgi:hypothetical protein